MSGWWSSLPSVAFVVASCVVRLYYSEPRNESRAKPHVTGFFELCNTDSV